MGVLGEKVDLAEDNVGSGPRPQGGRATQGGHKSKIQESLCTAW